jgi:hypothetical protein
MSVNLKILVVEPNYLGGMSFSKKPEPTLGMLGVRPFWAHTLLGVLRNTPMGSGFYIRAQRAWIQATRLDLFFTSNEFEHLIRAQHSPENVFRNLC